METMLSYHLCLNCRKVFVFDDDVEDHKRQTGHKRFYIQEFDIIFNPKVANELHLMLNQAIITSLRSLGERPMNALLWHLRNKGISIDSHNLDIQSFYAALDEILGPTADMIIEDVIKQLTIHYRINRGFEYDEKSYRHLSPMDRLRQVMTMILRYGVA